MKMITTFMLLFASVLLLGCDNSNDPAPDPGHVKVLLTSGAYPGTMAAGSGGGLAGADTTCTDVATLAGQTGTWTAWLSDSTTPAVDRIFDGGTRYQLINGTVIADNMADLLDGTLDAPILIDESGNEGGSKEVWTGTLADGTYPGVDTCSDWTTKDAAGRGLIGRADKVDATWSSVFADACSLFNRLYCFADAVSP